MEVKIKCLECGRATRHQEVGKVFYNLDDPLDIIFEKEIICNKCKKDISCRKAEIDHYFFMAICAANLSRIMNIEDGSEIPEHLQGAFCVKAPQMEKVRAFCRTMPVLKRNDELSKENDCHPKKT